MNSAAAARCGCDPAEGVFFGCPSTEGGPPFVGTWDKRESRGANPFARAPCREAFAVGRVPARGKSLRLRAVSGGFRRGERSCAGQILSLVRRVGRPSPRRAFSCGVNPFAFAPCREAFVEESLLARGKFFRPCAVSGGLRRGERSCAGQIFSLVRRVGRPSPWGAFLGGANPFARAPFREAFAEESLLAWGKSLRLRAVSGGFRRGERSCAGQILSLVRRVGRPSPRRAFSRGANPAHRPAAS